MILGLKEFMAVFNYVSDSQKCIIHLFMITDFEEIVLLY